MGKAGEGNKIGCDGACAQLEDACSLREDVSSQLQWIHVLKKANLLLLQGFYHNCSERWSFGHVGKTTRDDTHKCEEVLTNSKLVPLP